MTIKLEWSVRSFGDSQKVYRSESKFEADNLPAVLASIDANVGTHLDVTSVADTVYYYAVETVLGSRTMLSDVVRVAELESGGPPASPPVVESYQSNTGASTTTVVCNKPSGVQIGDLLLLVCMNDYSLNPLQFLDNVSGWSLTFAYGDTISDSHFGVYWRIADGTEPATQIVNSRNGNDWASHYIRVSGAHATTPINATGYTARSGAAYTAPAITTTVDLCLLIIGLAFDGQDGIPFSTAHPDYAITDEAGIAGSGGVGSCWGQADFGTAGLTEAPVILASTSDGAAVFQFAIAPA